MSSDIVRSPTNPGDWSSCSERGYRTLVYQNTDQWAVYEGQLPRGARTSWYIDLEDCKIDCCMLAQILVLRDLQNRGASVVVVIGDYFQKVADSNGAGDSLRRKYEACERFLETVRHVLIGESLEIFYNYELWRDVEFFRLADRMKHTSMRDLLNEHEYLGQTSSRRTLQILATPVFREYERDILNIHVELCSRGYYAYLTMSDSSVRKPEDCNLLRIVSLFESEDIGKDKAFLFARKQLPIANPTELFHFFMKTPNLLLQHCLIHLTRIPTDEICTLLPDQMGSPPSDDTEARIELARQIVRILFSVDESLRAESHYKMVYVNRLLPSDLPVHSTRPVSLVQLIVDLGIENSKKGARRLIEQGGISLNGEKVSKIDLQIVNDCLLTKGKFFFFRIVIDETN